MASACFSHPTVASVSTCMYCNRGLCVDCAASLNVCSGCVKSIVQSERRRIVTRLISGVLAGVVGAFLVYQLQEPATHHVAMWPQIIAFAVGAGLVYSFRYAAYPFRNIIVTPQLWFAGKLMQWVLAVAFAPIALAVGLIRDARYLRSGP